MRTRKLRYGLALQLAAADADYQAILSKDLTALDQALEKASFATVP